MERRERGRKGGGGRTRKKKQKNARRRINFYKEMKKRSENREAC